MKIKKKKKKEEWKIKIKIKKCTEKEDLSEQLSLVSDLIHIKLSWKKWNMSKNNHFWNDHVRE